MKGDPIKIGAISKIIFWAKEIKLIADIPQGARVRLRIRPKDFAQVFVKTSTGIRWHYIEDHGDVWKLGPLISENRTLGKI